MFSIYKNGSLATSPKINTINAIHSGTISDFTVPAYVINIIPSDTLYLEVSYEYYGTIDNYWTNTFNIDILGSASSLSSKLYSFTQTNISNNVLNSTDFYTLYGNYGLKCNNTGIFKTTDGGSTWTSL